MREISCEAIRSAVAALCIEANRDLPADVFHAAADGVSVN